MTTTLPLEECIQTLVWRVSNHLLHWFPVSPDGWNLMLTYGLAARHVDSTGLTDAETQHNNQSVI